MRAWLGEADAARDEVIVLKGADGGRTVYWAPSVLSRRPPMIGMKEAWLHEFGDTARDAILCRI
ncbi:MAG: hypothetical protein R3C58_00050 [Parvularculaceae bacterium]